ncbi:hypothetical protein PF008_g7573 [Phytophthora fragariae]|uniref:Uncharacterized protein n=1 Tax=Phytophthora fragariae TaxID=53985 RepID=A0A6G0S3T7_9STRA|nr:hypothetical protein PF008_g7573 [Phytophthora fragariae]
MHAAHPEDDGVIWRLTRAAYMYNLRATSTDEKKELTYYARDVIQKGLTGRDRSTQLSRLSFYTHRAIGICAREAATKSRASTTTKLGAPASAVRSSASIGTKSPTSYILYRQLLLRRFSSKELNEITGLIADARFTDGEKGHEQGIPIETICAAFGISPAPASPPASSPPPNSSTKSSAPSFCASSCAISSVGSCTTGSCASSCTSTVHQQHHCRKGRRRTKIPKLPGKIYGARA